MRIPEGLMHYYNNIPSWENFIDVSNTIESISDEEASLPMVLGFRYYRYNSLRIKKLQSSTPRSEGATTTQALDSSKAVQTVRGRKPLSWVFIYKKRYCTWLDHKIGTSKILVSFSTKCVWIATYNTKKVSSTNISHIFSCKTEVNAFLSCVCVLVRTSYITLMNGKREKNNADFQWEICLKALLGTP